MNNTPNAKKEDTKEKFGSCKSKVQSAYYNVTPRHVRATIVTAEKQ